MLGPVEAETLGFTLSHEHIVCGSPGVVRGWPALYGGRQRLLDTAQTVLTRAIADGVTTIVDATTFDLGREVDILVEASSRSGMHIVAATGMWLAPSPALTVRTTDQLADWFTADIAEGLDGTDVRAGIIKVASELELQALRGAGAGGGRQGASRDGRAHPHPLARPQPDGRAAGGGPGALRRRPDAGGHRPLR